ncbi:helix-turn-helix domain-containing protein [Clostridium botulinum]|uniref:helix-turn-helix domain-containing protein n=1 Tax=Clostridium botulinum TaxID=1491 RepID=UPI0004D7F049|nr:helix-turn-helix domain-containing protein [Clostridium botulinum]KEH99833.1 hypothetical protein Z952_p0162 [Clostridium botulinum C/D str. BKT75002]KEI05311.1 hypothetical protein Z954_0163 [Clostridium botulinum C/D str. BKT2873]QPW62000.1 helix-turn-helix domain-containing protein [Clostridium botulinum]
MGIVDKGIYILQIEDECIGFLNMDFIKNFDLKPNEVEFVKNLIPLQIDKGIDDWMILRLDDIAEQFNIPKPTVSRYMQKLKQTNILVQEDFRSPLWKFNPNIVHYEIR